MELVLGSAGEVLDQLLRLLLAQVILQFLPELLLVDPLLSEVPCQHAAPLPLAVASHGHPVKTGPVRERYVPDLESKFRRFLAKAVLEFGRLDAANMELDPIPKRLPMETCDLKKFVQAGGGCSSCRSVCDKRDLDDGDLGGGSLPAGRW